MNPYPYKAIVAVSQDGVIGRNGDLPWRLSGDLQWFKKITMGHTILMGRKTWDSLPKALPGRENWVLSRRNLRSEGMRLFSSLKDVAEHLPDRQTLFVIGGGEVYRQALPLCHELYITQVHQKVPDGDAFFPEYRDQFEAVEVLDENEDFLLRRWERRAN